MFLLMKGSNYYIFLLLCFCALNTVAQETLPIYQDYLSDNVYLIHPAAAGIGECGKIRITARKQWFGVDDAPDLQTVSFHAKMNADSKAAYGVVLFNDSNGFHSQKGLQGTYAYHLDLDQTNRFEQLSFGLSFSGVLNQADQTSFATFDPQVSQVIESSFYINADVGVGYHVNGFSSYLTVKNIFLKAKDELTAGFDNLNLRNYILGVGYFYGNKDTYQYEPSIMLQYKDQTGEKITDINFKIYKNLKKAKVWAALSYRRSFGSNSFDTSQFISPIIGFNFSSTLISYTYSKQLDDIVLSDGGFHQITLGFNLLCREPRLSACPNINGVLF